MTLGLIVSLIVTFLLLPCLINIFSSDNEIEIRSTEKSYITSLLGSIAKKNSIIVFSTTIIIICASVVGIFKLEVETVLSITLIKKQKYIKE